MNIFRRDRLDDIVFEGRNKSFGAYHLRNEYPRTLNRALLITLGVFGLFMALLLMQRTPPATIVEDHGPIEFIDFDKPLIPQSEPLVPTGKAPAAPETPTAQVAENTYRVVPTAPVEPLTTPATSVAPASGNAGETGQGSGETGEVPGFPVVGTMSPAAIDANLADQPPVFPGGLEKFYAYIQKHLVYTTIAREIGVSGRVYASFIIGADGKPREVKIIRGLGYGLDEKVLDVLSGSPEWQPGVLHGQPVATIFRIPVLFDLSK